MLKNEIRIITHPILGDIIIEPKFSKVLELKEFRSLAFKSQLGNKILSTNALNANHNRLMHSLGVMFLTEKLLEVCKKKFSKYFEITEKDEEILKLAALAHDIGHIAFSHSLEDKSIKPHEERTIERLQNLSGQINQIFGYDIVSEVIKIYQENINLKELGCEANFDVNLNILFVLKNLLVGAIDCDRMEYIMMDRFMLHGEKRDFRNIFNYLDIVLMNDVPVVVFEKEILTSIEDFLISRFDLYRYDYYKDDEVLVEMAVNDYVHLRGWSDSEKEEISEQEILSELIQNYTGKRNARAKEYRLSQIIIGWNRKNVMFRSFEDKKEYEHFLSRLGQIVDSSEIKTCNKSVSIYDPKKHKIYMKDSDRIVKDITEVSLKIKELSINLYYVMVDLEGEFTKQQISDIIRLFKDNPIEVEKKFILPDENSYMKNFSKENAYAVVESLKFQLAANISNEVLSSEAKFVINNDQYYIAIVNGEIMQNIAIRYRKSDDEECYYVKIPVDDGTSITKRYEYKYTNCKNIREFSKLLRSLITSNGYGDIEDFKLLEGIKIVTSRYEVVLNILDSVVEISCDFSNYYYKDREGSGIMLECELKEGDDLTLWYLANHIKKMGFIETNKSKETRAKEALGIK